MVIKKAIKYAWPWLAAVLCVGYLYWALEAYRVHCDAGFLPIILSFLAFAAITVFTLCQWRKDRAAALSAVIPAVACIALFLVARKIPNCPMCDGVTENGLGLPGSLDIRRAVIKELDNRSHHERKF